MRDVVLLSVFLICTGGRALSQHSPYAGEESRGIKAISERRLAGYLSGAGMGFAKAAELNHYPGPKHVLELAGELQLSGEQRRATEEALSVMHTRAVTLGENIVETERRLDGAFRTRKADSRLTQALVADIAKLEGELRFTHLKAHLRMSEILTPRQIDRYDELRGYVSGP